MRILTAVVALALVLVACGKSSSSNSGGSSSLSVRSVFPDNGPIAGEQDVAIGGTGFTTNPITQVLFGDAPATDVSVTSDSNISCKTPPNDTGWVDVTVIDSLGTEVTLERGYAYNAPPQVFAVAPVAGPAGLTVSIIGANFGDGSVKGPSVEFGGFESFAPQLVSGFLIFATTPVGPSGRVDVTVTNLNGSDTLEGGWIYLGGAPLRTTEAENLTPPVPAEGRIQIRQMLSAFERGEGPLTDVPEPHRSDVVRALRRLIDD